MKEAFNGLLMNILTPSPVIFFCIQYIDYIY